MIHFKSILLGAKYLFHHAKYVFPRAKYVFHHICISYISGLRSARGLEDGQRLPYSFYLLRNREYAWYLFPTHRAHSNNNLHINYFKW